jgi:hypothetical protein
MNGMITRIIYTEIWQDDFFVSLEPQEKLLFLYYLTNDSVNIIHLFRCNNQRTQADTGIDRGIIIKAQQKFEKAGKMYFKDGFVFLKNAHRFEKYEGPKNDVAKVKLINRLSKDIKDWYIKHSDRGIDTLYKSEIINHKSKTITHNTEIDNITNEVYEALERHK